MTQLAAPVIDGQGFLSRELDGVLPPAEVSTAIAQATQEVGMFQLVNHGIDEGLVRRLEVRRQAGWREQGKADRRLP